MPGLAAASPAPSESQEKKPLKPCCACPETKKARDAWSRGGYELFGETPAMTSYDYPPVLSLFDLPDSFQKCYPYFALGFE
ncbi:hypothetical protein JEQ12_001394 [Ovis aries]|uniref:Uncharacterized protein n=1 Tax=Ovis aries TaxID=9940 RepID=A0A836AJL4_SHEEP|nr:hypothetical protein JEQ12_001394 [Ovis aries]